jgi:hypothetical protein
MQYILYAVSENKDIFSHEEKEEADETAAPKGKDKKNEFPHILQSLHLSEHQKQKALKVSKKLIREKRKIEILLNQLNETKDEMK